MANGPAGRTVSCRAPVAPEQDVPGRRLRALRKEERVGAQQSHDPGKATQTRRRPVVGPWARQGDFTVLTSRLTTKFLAVLLLGCAGMVGACSVRVTAPSHERALEPFASGSDARRADAAPREGVRAMTGKLPLYFVENRGQEDGRVGYYVQGRDTAVYFTRTGVTFALSNTPAPRGTIDRPGRRAEIRPVA